MTQEVRDPDADLVRACRDPDDEAFEAAFETIYQRYCDRVYGVAYRITGNTADAMEATQDSFSALFRKISGFRADSLFSTWLFRLVVNCTIDMVRARAARSRATLYDSGQLDCLPAAENPPELAASHGELGDMIQVALQKLSEKLRTVLALRYLEGMSYEQIAGVLEISMGTVKSRLARAHLALEEVMRKDPAILSHLGEGAA